MIRFHKPILEPPGLTSPSSSSSWRWLTERRRPWGALGARPDMDTGTITPVVKRLEAAGMVTRQRDRNDERRVLVDLTGRSRALEAEVRSDRVCLQVVTTDDEGFPRDQCASSRLHFSEPSAQQAQRRFRPTVAGATTRRAGQVRAGEAEPGADAKLPSSGRNRALLHLLTSGRDPQCDSAIVAAPVRAGRLSRRYEAAAQYCRRVSHRR
ncbi:MULTISPECIES: transcriptional regulator, SarA/Rot family [Mycobacterium]|uniref:transcriptional regulator, SarA/Rot family n=1 Tax=Mycobacterium TaxID=1763 RepID=UPI0009F5D001|nr:MULTISPECIES: MarR family transcriptional regulator [Mycobacterium]MCV7393742.1 MarR family transcriptional regulator [Mycobacterium paraseoulense]